MAAVASRTLVRVVTRSRWVLILILLLAAEEGVDERLLLARAGAPRCGIILLLLDLLELGLTFSFRMILLHLLEKVLLPGAFKFHSLVRFNVVFFSNVSHNAHGMTHCKGVISDELGDGFAHVIDF